MTRRIRKLGIGFAALFGLIWIVQWGSRLAVGPSPLDQLTFSRAYLDRDGELLRLTTARDERFRLWVKLAEISPQFVQLVLTKEDHFFYWHPGVNALALVRSAVAMLRSPGRVPGGSTITMQLARLLWKLETTTISGKIQQIFYALALEARYAKAEILEAYLNLAPYGGNIEGVASASWIYFHKAPLLLTEAESLRLAMIPQNPVYRHLWRSGELGTREQAAMRRLAHKVFGAKSDALAHALDLRGYPLSSLPWHAPHFTERLTQTMPLPGARESGQIATTLSLKIQRVVEDTVTRSLRQINHLGIKNAAALLVHAPSMSVRAYVGSADFGDVSLAGQVDGIRARRSPGSTLKPLIFGLAIDDGWINPQTALFDVPAGFGVYDPENFDRDFMGPMSTTEALTRSRNIPAIGLLKDIGVARLYDALVRVGVPLARPVTDYGLPIAVGGAELSMESLVGLYSGLVTGGDVRPLRILPQQELQAVRFFSADAARMVRGMLESQPRVDSLNIKSERLGDERRPKYAWKTGTSFGFHDAWTIGVFGDWVLGVWLGDFSGTPNTALVGREVAAPLWFQLTDAFLSTELLRREEPYKAPVAQRMQRVKVCPLSGDLPGAGCKHSVWTWEIPGISPHRECPLHRVLRVSKSTGHIICPAVDAPAEEKVFEVWPSHLAGYLRRVGLAIASLPPVETGCPPIAGMNERREFSQVEITSPRSEVEYQKPLNAQRTSDPVMLTAHGPADSEKFFWYVDDQYVGMTTPEESLPWALKPGRYTIRTVDQKGRQSQRRVVVRAVF